jgi:hypothetical protein
MSGCHALFDQEAGERDTAVAHWRARLRPRHLERLIALRERIHNAVAYARCRGAAS